MTPRIRCGLIAGYMLLASQAQAVIVEGQYLPDTWPLSTHQLVLNGAGVREYSLFNIALYAAALYTDKKHKDPQTILQSNRPRVVHLIVLRSASQADSVRAWRAYLVANCKAPCVLPADVLAQFEQLIPDAQLGDSQTYVFDNGTLSIYRNHKRLGRIDHAEFSIKVLETWLGAVPTSQRLKQHLLGSSE